MCNDDAPHDPGPAPVSHAVDGAYPTPITAVPRITSGTAQVYDANGNVEGGRWIDVGDVCTITAVYTDGWIQVSYPSGSSHRTAYVPKDTFFASNGIINGSWSPSENVDSYTHEDLSKDFGDVWSSDSCVVVGQSGGSLQVIYPAGSVYKLGWVPGGSNPAPPAPDSLPEHVDIPGIVAEGIFDGKGVVVMAPERIDFGNNEYIDAGDVCIITEVDKNTGYCDVTYPSGGDDVFTCRQKDKRVPITYFIEYQPNFRTQRVTTDESFTVYPTSDYQTHGRTWALDPGDEYHTTARAGNGATQVLYECTRGAHEGWWKLGWVDLPYYWLDLNGWLDGAGYGDLGSYGAADVWINGNCLVRYARDFYSANGMFPRGSTYEIKNIVASDGYTYNGVHSGSASGTMKGNVGVALDFTKNPATLFDIRITGKPSKLEYMEGESLDKTGLKVEAVMSDGGTSDVTGQCSLSGFDGNPGVKTVVVSYGGKTTAFTVVVKSKSPTKLTVSSKPMKTQYKVNDEIVIDGLKVTATYDNGTSEVVDDYGVMIDEGITSTAGTKSITVVYDYNNVVVDTTFDITVTAQGSTDPVTPTTPVDGPTLSVVASDQVNVGGTFDVKLNLTNNEGIASLKVKVNFDANLLQLTKVTYATNMGGMSQQPQTLNAPVTLNWFNGSQDFVGDATFATLTFKATGASGSMATIGITYNPNDVYNISEDNVGLNVRNKTIGIGNSGGNGWVILPSGAKGYRKNGKLVTGWMDLGTSKLWFHPDGAMAIGWTPVVVNGSTMHYYFNPASGNLVRGTWFEIDGYKYYFRPSGNVAHGWATITDNGVDKKYYFDDEYHMVTGWQEIEVNGNVIRYYFRPSGSMATGWATIDGQKYWFRPSGSMATGFNTVEDGHKRYFDKSGHMLTGWQVIDGKTFYFRDSGAMQTGEMKMNGVTYVFTVNGTLSSVIVGSQSDGEELMVAQAALDAVGLDAEELEDAGVAYVKQDEGQQDGSTEKKTDAGLVVQEDRLVGVVDDDVVEL